MKLPFTIKLGAIKGAFARLKPSGLVSRVSGAFKGKIKFPAKLSLKLPFKFGKKGAKDERGEDDFRPSSAEDKDMFADLGDLDELDAQAAARQAGGGEVPDEEYATDRADNLDDMSVGSDGEVVTEAERDFADLDAEEAAGGEGEEGFDLAALEAMPDFEDEFAEEEESEAAQRVKKKKLLLIAGGGVAAAVLIGAASWALLSGGGGESEAEIAVQPTVNGHDAVISLENVPFAEQPASVAPAPSREPSGGLTPPQGVAGGGMPEAAMSEEGRTLGQLGLNVAQEPGVGVVVPAVTRASFAGVPAAPSGEPLAVAPIDVLAEQTDLGILPKIAEDGLTPYDAYARPEPQMDGTAPKVAVIVTDVGLSRASTESAISAMPQEVTLALNAYARGLDFWVSRARDDGHEVLLSLPLESGDFPFDDPGPDALKVLVTPEENVAKLEYILSRTSGYFGVLADHGGKFLTAEDQVDGVMEQLKARGLMYVDGGVPGSLGTRSAYKYNIPWAAVELNLDDAQGRAEFERMLDEFENLANKRAIAIARVSVTPLAMEQLNAWLSTLGQKGFQLVPVSALAKKQIIR